MRVAPKSVFSSDWKGFVDHDWTMILIATTTGWRRDTSICPKLVLVQILIGNVVLRDLMGVYFLRILIVSFLHACHRSRLTNVSFFNQLIDAFRIRLLGPGQTF